MSQTQTIYVPPVTIATLQSTIVQVQMLMSNFNLILNKLTTQIGTIPTQAATTVATMQSYIAQMQDVAVQFSFVLDQLLLQVGTL